MRVRSPREIGLLIRERRRERGWDQQTLADRIGASRLWISEMENGKRSVQLDMVLRALAAVDLDLDAAPHEGVKRRMDANEPTDTSSLIERTVARR